MRSIAAGGLQVATQQSKGFSGTCEQAAKECGDAYTNKLKVETTGKDGGPIRTETTNLTAEEAGEAYRKFMG